MGCVNLCRLQVEQPSRLICEAHFSVQAVAKVMRDTGTGSWNHITMGISWAYFDVRQIDWDQGVDIGPA
jgi:hypothetical protein